MTNEDISQEEHLIKLRESLVKELIRIRDEALEDRRESNLRDVKFREKIGICERIALHTPHLRMHHEILQEAFRAWDKFSGNIVFPVPSTRQELSACDMHDFTLNKWEGEYGQLRFELLEFCIDYIQSKV